jgi:hypothetical protein
MLCGIHQPQFIPWPGYFNKIALSDVFVLLDTVQYKKNEYQNRNRIRTAQGWNWLTVPVSFRFGDTLAQTAALTDERWLRKTEQSLKTHYAKAPFYAQFAPPFLDLLRPEYPSLAALNTAVIRWMCEVFDLRTPLHLASECGPLPEEPTRRLTELCRRNGADAYLSGKDGPNYMDLSVFSEERVRLFLQEFTPPRYPQQFIKNEAGFEPYMSALDLLFNLGPEVASAIIRQSGTSIEWKEPA